MNLTDCTDTLRLRYDRGSDGYGVPVPGVRFKGTVKLSGVLWDVRHDLEQIGWWDYIESVLTAGLYVNKKGAHGDGKAIDIDGVVLKPNPFYEGRTRILVYGANYFEGYDEDKVSLPDRIKTRLACLLSLRFPEVLTAGYNKAHEDHIHASIAGEVGWRGSRSQVVCLQETLNAWFDAGLVVDGELGRKTRSAWNEACLAIPDIGLENLYWQGWLTMIAFNPPVTS